MEEVMYGRNKRKSQNEFFQRIVRLNFNEIIKQFDDVLFRPHLSYNGTHTKNFIFFYFSRCFCTHK